MSQTKYKLPDDLKMRCLSFVKGYNRLVRLYHERRADVMYGSSPTAIAIGDNNNISNSTLSKTERLDKIEQMFDTKVMFAVEEARLQIGEQLIDEQRTLLDELIQECCIYGRYFRYEERRGDLCYEKSQFYELRAKYLYDIAINMGFI